MAKLQSLVKVLERFSDVAELLFNQILMQAGKAIKGDYVGERYPKVSTKNTERDKRSSSGQLTVNITSSQQLCLRQWKKFMLIGSNKEGLMQFLVSERSTNQEYADKLGYRKLYVTHENQ